MRAHASTNWLHSILALLVLSASSVRAGHVSTDGTLGRARTLSGPNFSIGPNLGQQRGGNLFHSFSAFDLAAGDTAIFTGPSSVHNVFARITGGEPSGIDGTIACTIPNASFYLINPNGVMFGPDAALDVKGSFAVTTADAIKFGSDGSFNATHPAASALTIAAPAAFGFLSSSPAGVSIRGDATTPCRLAVPPQQALSVVSGPIRIDHGRLVAPGGQANLIAVASPGQAMLNATPSALSDAVSFPVPARISIGRSSGISLDGPAGGGFFVRGSDLSLDASFIASNTRGSGQGAEGIVELTGTLRLTHAASVATYLGGDGRGGNLYISAAQVVLDDRGALHEAALATTTTARSGVGGRSGDFFLQTSSLRLLAGGIVDGSALGKANGGNLNIAAAHQLLDNRGNSNPNGFTGIDADPNSTGNGGELTIHALNVQLVAGAEISASPTGRGNGGNLSITAKRLTLDDRGDTNSDGQTGIFADTSSSGDAGNLIVHADTIKMLAGGDISAGSAGTGHGGNLDITANTVILDDRGDLNFSVNVTGAFVQTFGSSGSAGDLTLHASTLEVLAGAEVSSSTFDTGRGGNVRVVVGSLTLDDRGDPNPNGNTGIFASAEAGSTGNAGDLTVHAATIRVLAGAVMDVDTFGAGHGGNFSIATDRLTLDDRGNARSAEFPTGIAASADPGSSGNAGSLTIHAAVMDVLAGAQVSAAAFSSGDGGNLDVTAGRLTVDNRGNPEAGVRAAGIFASTLSSGNAGDVTVDAGALQVLAGAQIGASTFGSGRGGSVLIQAQSVLLDGSSPEGSQSLVDSLSDGGSGAAGSVSVSVHSNLTLSRGATIASSSQLSTAGDIQLSSDATIVLDGGDITAKAKGAAGNISISTPLLIQLVHHSLITTASGTANGGDISINALEVSLRQSGVHADALQGVGGNISIAADATPGAISEGPLIQRSVTATGKAGISGNIQNAPATTDIAQSVTALAAPLDSGTLTLQPQCGQMIDVSTFLIQGRGSVADDPGLWEIGLDSGFQGSPR